MRVRDAILAGALTASCGCERAPPPPSTAPPPPGPPPAQTQAPPQQAQPAQAPAPAAQPAAAPAPAAQQAPPPAQAAKPPERKNPFKAPEHFNELQRLYAEATAAIAAGDKAKALDLLDDVLALEQGHRLASRDKARLLRGMGRYDEALAAISEGLKITADDTYLLEEKAWILLEKGETKAALSVVDGALKSDLPLPGLRYQRAVIRTVLSDKEGALAALEDALEHGFLGHSIMEAEKRFEPIRREKRFEAVLDKIRDTLARSQAAAVAFQAHEEDRPLPEVWAADYREQIETLVGNVSRGKGEDLEIDLTDVDGKPLRVADHKGKVVFVQVWGAWSEACRKMIPEILRLKEEYKDKGVVVLSLCYEPAAVPGEEQEVVLNVKAFQRENKFDVPCAVIDKEYSALKLYVSGYPVTLLFGKEGKMHLRSYGFKAYHVLRGMADILLGTAGAKDAALRDLDREKAPEKR
ncbi:MAG: redoxin domain-containing protein [Planctomycetes bacterium]|nr:redoxin domain-containing protein [Planctomycetota bacterium]